MRAACSLNRRSHLRSIVRKNDSGGGGMTKHKEKWATVQGQSETKDERKLRCCCLTGVEAPYLFSSPFSLPVGAAMGSATSPQTYSTSGPFSTTALST